MPTLTVPAPAPAPAPAPVLATRVPAEHPVAPVHPALGRPLADEEWIFLADAWHADV